MLFCAPFQPATEELQTQFLTDDAKRILAGFAENASKLNTWTSEALDALIKETLSEHGIKMPMLGIPLRLAVTGQKQTPSIGAVLAIIGKTIVLERLQNAI